MEAFFLFVSLSFRNSPGYPHRFEGYTLNPLSYPQFKKVFSPSGDKIHTSCAQVFRGENFASILKPQNGSCGVFGVFEQGK
jgi:hypothetical protein